MQVPGIRSLPPASGLHLSGFLLVLLASNGNFGSFETTLWQTAVWLPLFVLIAVSMFSFGFCLTSLQYCACGGEC